MSYDRVNPTYYETYQQGTPFHAGAPGWSTAPWINWGNNPNLAGRRLLATDGLGKIVAVSGLGDPISDALTEPTPGWWRALSMASAAACAYHGYIRNNESLGWTAAWAFFGGTIPVLAVPIALAQGFGEPKKEHVPNRRRGRRRRR